MEALLGWLALVYFGGMVVAFFVYPRRIGGGRYAYATAVMHPPSRRNGIPWLAKTIVKLVAWPIVLAIWLSEGRPASKELYGPAAGERLGIPESHVTGARGAFATKWTSGR